MLHYVPGITMALVRDRVQRARAAGQLPNPPALPMGHPYTYCASNPLNCIDPSGMVLHFINCNEWKQRQIERQWNDVCQNRMRFLSRQARQCIQSRCDGDLWVECNVQSDPSCAGNCGFTAPHPRRHIHMCDDAFYRPKCGCLGKTLLHEAIHSCKEDFAEWPPMQCEWDAYGGRGKPPCPPYT